MCRAVEQTARYVQVTQSMSDDHRSPNDRIAALERDVEALLGLVQGLTVAVGSLIAKHHDHAQLQLHLTTLLERTDATAFGAMSPRQREVARLLVEELQVRAVPHAIDPLKSLRPPPGPAAKDGE